MTMIADFDADFGKFNSAVAGATAQLKSFTVDSDKVGAALGRMTDQFSGAKVIQQATLMSEAIERLGGVGVLTEKELARIAPTIQEAIDKAKKLGVEVPANLRKLHDETSKIPPAMSAIGSMAQQIAGPLAALFSVQTVINFGREILNAADAISKMAAQTKLSTDEVQQLMFIAGQTSVEMGTLVSAAQTLAERLGEGNSGTTKALRDMGIELKDFASAGTYDRLLQVSDGLRAITDDTKQAEAGAALFGGKWKEVIPALLEDMRALGDEAPKMQEKTVGAWDAIGDRMGLIWDRTKVALAEVGLFTKAYADGLIAQSLALQGFVDLLDRAFGPQARRDDPFGAESAFAKIPPIQRDVIAGFEGISMATVQAMADGKEYGLALKASMDADAEATRNAAAEKAKLDAANKAYWDGVAGFVERFTGTDALALAKTWQDAVTQIETLGGAISDLSHSDLAELEAAMQGALAVMARQGTLTGELSGEFTRLMLAAADANRVLAATPPIVDAASGTVTEYTRALYDAAIAEDRERDAAAAKNAELQKTKDAAEEAAAAMNRAREYSLTAGLPTPESLDAAARYPGSMLGFGIGGELPRGMNVFSQAPLKLPNFRAAGGPVAAGTSYVVGERGPELFTPSSSGAITPNGGAGAVVVNNTFHIVDTAANLAREVSAVIARTITQARRV